MPTVRPSWMDETRTMNRYDSSARRALVLEAVDHEHATATCGSVVVQVWAGAVTESVVAAMLDGVDALDEPQDRGVTVLCVARPDAPVHMTRAAMERIAAQLEGATPRVQQLVVVMSGDGLTRWIRTGLVRAISMSARPQSLRCFSQLDDALGWVADDRGDADATSLGLAVEELGQRIDQCRNPRLRSRRSTMMLAPDAS